MFVADLIHLKPCSFVLRYLGYKQNKIRLTKDAQKTHKERVYMVTDATLEL